MKSLHLLTIVLGLALAGSAGAQFPPITEKSLTHPGVWKDAKAVDRIKALKVAEIDAKRGLAERIYGHQIVAGLSVHDYMMGDNAIRSNLDVVLKGAREIQAPTYDEHGIVYAYYGVKLRTVYEVVRTAAVTRGNQTVVDAVDHEIVNEDKTIYARGNGALPGSRGLRRIRAKRAAELDAFRQIAEQIAGLRITGDSRVRDFMLESDSIQTSVTALIKGLKPESIAYGEDDSCDVAMKMTVREVIETLETIIRTHKRGFRTSREEIRNINQHVEDKHFTVTGNGAPRDQVAPLPASAAAAIDSVYEEERLIIRRVIATDVVVD